jgi:hypothetical protein
MGEREHILPPQPAPAKGKPNSKNSRVRDRVSAILRDSGPMHRTGILERLLADGMLGTERKPMNRLASILASNSTLFSSDSRGTYSLMTAGHTEQSRVPERTGRSTLAARQGCLAGREAGMPALRSHFRETGVPWPSEWRPARCLEVSDCGPLPSGAYWTEKAPTTGASPASGHFDVRVLEGTAANAAAQAPGEKKLAS